MDITIVIPARAGSTRVVNKNFKPFANSSLIEIKIKQAKKLGLPIVIDSDSNVAKDLAAKYGVEYKRRPDFYASSECNNSQYYEYLGNSVSTKYIMILQPTAPLLKDETLKNCYEEFEKNCNQYDSLVTALFAKKHAWYKDSPINYDLANTPNSQDLDPIKLPTFNVMISEISSLLRTKNAITNNCLFYPIEEAEGIEIDTPLDFEIAEFLYERNHGNQ
jgi:N-acylneuraminate cytidylyltransferase